MRAEAGRAKAEGKLIPVKTTDVAYGDIPLPFGEMHTENVGSTDLIRAAIVAQLAKPAVQQSAFWQITSTFKYQVLSWIGIVGSAITLFANLNGVLNFADWARELVKHWHEWNQIVWGWAFSLIKLPVPKELVPVISFTVFTLVLVVGINLASPVRQQSTKSPNVKSLIKKLGILVGGILLYLGTLVVIGLIFIGTDLVPMNGWRDAITVLSAISVPTAYLLFFGRERLLILTASLLFLAMGGFLLVAPTFEAGMRTSGEQVAVLVFVGSGFILLQICWMAVILFSPLRQLARRLSFVVLGVITLVALSEISKLNLHQYLQPPKVSDSSVPAQIVVSQ